MLSQIAPLLFSQREMGEEIWIAIVEEIFSILKSEIKEFSLGSFLDFCKEVHRPICFSGVEKPQEELKSLQERRGLYFVAIPSSQWEKRNEMWPIVEINRRGEIYLIVLRSTEEKAKGDVFYVFDYSVSLTTPQQLVSEVVCFPPLNLRADLIRLIEEHVSRREKLLKKAREMQNRLQLLCFLVDLAIVAKKS